MLEEQKSLKVAEFFKECLKANTDVSACMLCIVPTIKCNKWWSDMSCRLLWNHIFFTGNVTKNFYHYVINCISNIPLSKPDTYVFSLCWLTCWGLECFRIFCMLLTCHDNQIASAKRSLTSTSRIPHWQEGSDWHKPSRLSTFCA